MSQEDRVKGAEIFDNLLHSVADELKMEITGVKWRKDHPTNESERFHATKYQILVDVGGKELEFMLPEEYLQDLADDERIRDQAKAEIINEFSK